jgi:hypothetical protein
VSIYRACADYGSVSFGFSRPSRGQPVHVSREREGSSAYGFLAHTRGQQVKPCTHGPGTFTVARGELLVHGLTLGARNDVVAAGRIRPLALHEGLGDVDDVAEQALGEILRELFAEHDAEDLFLLGVRGQVVAAEGSETPLVSRLPHILGRALPLRHLAANRTCTSGNILLVPV